MKIKQQTDKFTFWNTIFTYVQGKKVFLRMLLGAAFLLLMAWGALGIFEPHLKNRIQNYLTIRLGNLHEMPAKYIRSQFLTNPNTFIIDIKHKHFQELAYQRHLSLEQNTLIDQLEEVPATIKFNEEAYKVKLRLKGKLSDHWEEEDMWSLKVKVKGEKAISGMRSFALQHPARRNYLNEWLFQRLAGYVDIINLRYDFISVNINGKGANIYAIEEGLDKLLIENNRRKEGVIIEFNKDFYWAFGQNLLIESVNGASITPFQAKKVLADSNLKQQFLKANNLLDAFKKGTLSTNQVFDIKKLAKLFAINGLMGHQHSLQLANIRFYFNPITSLLEPIAYDQEYIFPIEEFGGLVGEEKRIGVISPNNSDKVVVDFSWYNRLFSDEQFFETYLKELEIISNKTFLDSFFVQIDEELAKKQAIINSSFPNYTFQGKSILYRNQTYIKHSITPNNKINAYAKTIDKPTNKLGIEIKNVCTFPIEITSLTIRDSLTIPVASKSIVQASNKMKLAEKISVEFDIPTTFLLNDTLIESLKINYRFLDNELSGTTTVYPWAESTEAITFNDILRTPSNVEQFDFLEIDETNKIINCKTGKFTLSTNLIIPEGYTFTMVGGTEFDLKNKSNIFSHSPIALKGNAAAPINIYSSDSTGQGVIIMNANKPSYLEHVNIYNLANPNQNNWSLTGAITFVYSPVNIKNCYFASNRLGDDLLNVVHSDFYIEHTTFKDANADALDSDFSNGYLINTKFIRPGNDGVDVSGTELTIDQIEITEAGDKAISAGESSHIKITNVLIQRSELAFTSKDNSKIDAEAIVINDSRVGFTVFQKKPEFGPGNIIAKGFQLNNIEYPYLVEEGSSLMLNDSIILFNRKNVEEALYGNLFGKSSR